VIWSNSCLQCDVPSSLNPSRFCTPVELLFLKVVHARLNHQKVLKCIFKVKNPPWLHLLSFLRINLIVCLPSSIVTQSTNTFVLSWASAFKARFSNVQHETVIGATQFAHATYQEMNCWASINSNFFCWSTRSPPNPTTMCAYVRYVMIA